MSSAAEDRYSQVAVALHWGIAILLIGQIAGGWYMHAVATGQERFALYQWHKSFGVIVLLLSLARLAWRVYHPPPALPPDMKLWERRAAAMTHIAMYGVMIGIPLLGWLIVSSSPKEIPTILFESVPWPHLPGVPKSDGLEEISAELHKFFAYATIGLLALHVGAALKHHFINRDGVLARMLPFIRRSSS